MIPIYSSGGIGDQIIAIPWLEMFREQPVRLYTTYPDIWRIFAPWLEIVDNERTRRDGDFIIVLNDFVDFRFHRPGDQLEILPEVLHPLYLARLTVDAEWGDLIRAEPHRANEMGRLAVSKGLRRWTLPFYCVGRQYQKFSWDCVGIREPQRFITVHDGFDMHYRFTASMKSWDLGHWSEFVRAFKTRRPDIKVVQLGGAKHRKIPGVDIDLAGKLPFHQSLAFLKSAMVHVDGDSGLVHARRVFNRPSVVIFGPTNWEYFGYPENRNLAPIFCGNCWWTRPNWMQTCVKGHPRPLCTESVRPQAVLDAALALVNEYEQNGSATSI